MKDKLSSEELGKSEFKQDDDRNPYEDLLIRLKNISESITLIENNFLSR